jgi:hypothetical protein
MVDFPARDERAAFYREKADEAVRRAQAATSPQIRLTFLQIAKSYENLASAVEDIARKRG